MNRILYSGNEIERLLISAVSDSIILEKYSHILTASIWEAKSIIGCIPEIIQREILAEKVRSPHRNIRDIVADYKAEIEDRGYSNE